MKKTLLLPFLFFVFSFPLVAQQTLNVLEAKNTIRCATQVSIKEAIKKNPGITEIWRKAGEMQYQAYLQRQSFQRGPTDINENEIIIPIVFHLVDDSANLSVISDRDIYEQVELLNKAYNGYKADEYKKVIPGEIYSRLGRIPIKFVLARRTPTGNLTSGIERRVNTTPDRIGVKSTITGGLDAWNTNGYLNVWAGSFSGDDLGLLGIATPPFYTSEGPQGIVMALFALPYTSNVTRSYYPAYAEGVTLIHEIGHYFYLWHTFGDETYCNNLDFRIQAGWPLPVGAGPEGDDTPEEKGDVEGSGHYGNPSQNYSDGCEKAAYGMMYGSFMNYFDDRAMFMFSSGMSKRVIGCIDLYRPGLKTSNGATPPSTITEAYLVTTSPRGTIERRSYILNNTPLKVVVRNNGNTQLNAVTVNIKMDAGTTVAYPYSLNLSPGKDTTLAAGSLGGTSGTHTVTVFISKPNNTTDAFVNNDTLESFIFINQVAINAPFSEDFSGSAFPPADWQVWNPNSGKTWEKSISSGFNTVGSATVQNFSYKGGGQLDELITPHINMGIADSSLLSFGVAYRVYSDTDVSVWDGLEVYLSNDGGSNYQLIYKKTGNQLKTVVAPLTSSFSAPLGSPGNWRKESINLTSYLVPGQKFLLKFRQVTAYGNNFYLDDISVSAFVSVDRDVKPTLITGLPVYVCEGNITPGVTFKSEGSQNTTSLKINYKIDNGNIATLNWSGTLTQGQEASLTLPAIPAQAPGAHFLTIYTSLPNGLNDLNVINDTIRQTFYTMGREVSPSMVDFEKVNFPPSQWVVANFDQGITWERTTTAAASGLGSMLIPNFQAIVSGTTDHFISPIISGNELYDSVFVSFDYAYATGDLQATKLDTLKIAITLDCGKSFIPIWKKWGPDLQSPEGPGNAGSDYIPQEGDWKNVKIPLFPITGTNNFQVFFTFKGNSQNNIYVDNINIFGVTVPPRLKQQGYLIYPNPFTNQFIIRNYEEPLGFKSAALFNTAGQRVWRQVFEGKAFKEVYVNGSRLPKGVYTLKLFYDDKTIVEKIVKME